VKTYPISTEKVRPLYPEVKGNPPVPIPKLKPLMASLSSDGIIKDAKKKKSPQENGNFFHFYLPGVLSFSHEIVQSLCQMEECHFQRRKGSQKP
jgi:hypothetical protein